MKPIRFLLLPLLLLCLSAVAFAQTVGGAVTFVGTASDATPAAGDTECGVASLQFFNGDVPLSPVLTAPTSGNDYAFVWNTKAVPNGTYAITAVAKDKAGTGDSPATLCDSSKQNVSTSNVLNIVVDNRPADTNGPSITITITVTVKP